MNILRKGHTYIIINAPYEGICVEFERKLMPVSTTLCKNPLNIIFADVGV